MSLDAELICKCCQSLLWERNITHNLGEMAEAAGLYKALWRPENGGYRTGSDLIDPLKRGLAKLKKNPAKYGAYNPANGWGSYANLVSFVSDYLEAATKHPTAEIRVSR